MPKNKKDPKKSSKKTARKSVKKTAEKSVKEPFDQSMEKSSENSAVNPGNEVINSEETSEDMTKENNSVKETGLDSDAGEKVPEAEKADAPKADVHKKSVPKARKLLADELKQKAVISNPVLVRLLAVCTVLGATTALKNGLLLSVAALLVTVPLYLIMSLLRKLPKLYYYPVALLIAGALETPVIMLAGFFAPEVTAACSFYLPLTALNAVLMLDLTLMRGERPFIRALGAGIGDVLGYSAVLIVVSALREIIGAGSIYGRALPSYLQSNFNFLLLPPGAFILVGLLLAIVQQIKLGKAKKNGGDAQ